MELINIAVKAVFIENILLAYFLGMCSFLALSKKLKTAVGLGLAVIFVLAITTPINWILNEYILRENALIWVDKLFGNSSHYFAKIDLSFLTFIVFIAVIAGVVQLVEMLVDKVSQRLYEALGIYLPLITVNCAILGVSLFMVERKYTFMESTVFGIFSGFGWLLAIISMAAIRKKLRYSNIPEGMQGLGITMLLTGLIAIAFMIFSGITVGN